MQIFKDFGVNPYLLVAQIVNFLIILYVLKRFMYKPVLSMLKKREDDIKEGIKQAEEGRKILEEATISEKEILQKAQTQAEKIITEARNESLSLKSEMEVSAKKEAERILAQARETIARETADAEERLTQKIGKFAIALLERSLKGIFGENEQKLILKKAINQLEKQKAL